MRPGVTAIAGAALALLLAAAPYAEQEASACPAELEARGREVAGNPDDLSAGADYRQAAIRCGAFDRSIEFFKRLAKTHSESVNVRLNLALAYVDKIPTAGDLRQALLGRDAIREFGKANEIRPTWLGHYTRGFIYLNYPRAFGAGPKAVAEFERAIALHSMEQPDLHRARAWVALGDAHYWRLSNLEKAREVWSEGARWFPDDEALRLRLTSAVKPLREIIRKTMNPDVRVDTSLSELRPRTPPLAPGPAR